MGAYLYYDVKGIQTFIFKIPKLKHIVGGSALIDRFDKETMKNLNLPDVDYVFSGGGKGAFFCRPGTNLEKVKKTIINEAHSIGLDIRFGLHNDFSQAAHQADELHPFVPKLCDDDALPCPETGLYPVKKGKQRHDIIDCRLPRKNPDLFRRFENLLLSQINFPGKTKDDFQFFHNVNPKDENGKVDEDGTKGAFALGNRNRWAAVCMDGNDMGRHFHEQLARKLEDKQMKSWIQTMSPALDKTTIEAAAAGTQRVVAEWAGSDEGKKAFLEDGKIILPIRPLLVGGDDIVVLCHCSYAVTFVKEVMRVFEERSREKRHLYLWPATDNGLTISAGILYAPVTLPLHTAIPYAEKLLNSAKTRGREKSTARRSASPACIDWEQITETVIDTPEAKRQRELIFRDEQIQRTVKLTRRPYTMEEFSKVQTLAEKYSRDRACRLPRTIRHRILPALQKGQAQRLAFYAQIKKHHPHLFVSLNELDMGKSGWLLNSEKNEQSISLIDALMLIEEENRMEQETVQ